MAAARNNRRNRRGRGRFGPLFKLLCLLAVVVALTVGATVFFRVEAVVVLGNVRYTQDEVIQAAGIQMGDNLFYMNKNQVAGQVRQQLPYVGELTIRRSLPSTIVITVSEWDAVARIEAPDPAALPDLEEERAELAESSAGGSALRVAGEPWLINIGGKLLEPAPEGHDAISVTGITPLSPSAGTMLNLPGEEQDKHTALLALLAALDKKGMLEQVPWVELGSTRVRLRYLDRFTVKMTLNGDFDYLLRAMSDAVTDLNSRVGPDCTGSLDLTQKKYQVVYSPDQ